jgi:CRP-like cAMP-binding protein
MKRDFEKEVLEAARQNRLLNALPAKDLEAVVGGATLTQLLHGRKLYREGGPVDSVYFPTHGVVSILTVAAERGGVEMASVGNEGVAGVDIVLGVSKALGRTVIQVAGEGIVLSANRFMDLLRKKPQFSLLIHRYLYAFVRQVMQTAACCHIHTAEERCARWLLMTHDRTDGNEFALTQDTLATMLGTRRALVNRALALFRRAGAIKYVYRKIAVIDRKQLESFSCDCYEIIRDTYELVRV